MDADFLNNVLNCAQMTATRLLHPGPATKFENLYLLILISADRLPGSQNWGYFQIQKTRYMEEKSGYSDHTIEFYFY
jgi:hypothetical protein